MIVILAREMSAWKTLTAQETIKMVEMVMVRARMHNCLNENPCLLSAAIMKPFLLSVIISEIVFNSSPAFIFAMSSK